MTEGQRTEKFHALLRYEAAREAYEIARDAEQAIRESWERAESLKWEARRKVEVAEAGLLGRRARHD